MTRGKLSIRVYWAATINTGRRCDFSLTVVLGQNHRARTVKCANDGRRNHLVPRIKNQLDARISQIYFWNKTLHVSESSCVHHQEFFTVHTAMVYVIYHVTYNIAVCTVKNNFWNKTLHVSDSSSVHHQEFFTVHTAMVYVIYHMTYTIAVCIVKNNFWNKTLHVSESSSVHHQEFFTVHTAMLYVVYHMTYIIAVCTVKNNFWNKTLHVSESSCVHHQEFFTVHTAMVYVIQVCWQQDPSIRPDPAHKLSANRYNIYHCCVYSEKLLMMDTGTVRKMQSFIPKINFRN